MLAVGPEIKHQLLFLFTKPESVWMMFHSFLNTLGEILGFADRNFYSDWWNADDLFHFWKMWNLPVHRWAVR